MTQTIKKVLRSTGVAMTLSALVSMVPVVTQATGIHIDMDETSQRMINKNSAIADKPEADAHYPSCSFDPPFKCTTDKNECGHPSSCDCPALYTYNPATGKCDLSFKESPQEGNIEIVHPTCSIDPLGKCTKDINICGNPSHCTCPSRPVLYKYNPATKKCDLANPRVVRSDLRTGAGPTPGKIPAMVCRDIIVDNIHQRFAKGCKEEGGRYWDEVTSKVWLQKKGPE